MGAVASSSESDNGTSVSISGKNLFISGKLFDCRFLRKIPFHGVSYLHVKLITWTFLEIRATLLQ
jgi:hypothetical protein